MTARGRGRWQICRSLDAEEARILDAMLRKGAAVSPHCVRDNGKGAKQIRTPDENEQTEEVVIID